MNIKVSDELKDSKFFNNNEYFKKYLDLIEKNLINKKSKCVRYQKHHIIPKCLCKIKGYNYSNKSDRLYINRKENIVLLSYSDHLLAHYYLCLCAVDYVFSYNLKIAFVLLTKCNTENFNLNSLDKYNEIYKRYIDDKNGRIRINNGIEEKVILKQELDKYLTEGYNQGRLKSTTKAKKGMHRDGVYTLVDEKDIENMLKQGWELGGLQYSEEEKNKRKALGKGRPKKVGVSKDNVEKRISIIDLDKYLKKGWERKGLSKSDEMKRKLRETNRKIKRRSYAKDKIIVSKNNKNKYIALSELNYYLETGWEKKKIITKKIKGVKYVIKDGVVKKIDKEEYRGYIQNGWCPARFADTKPGYMNKTGRHLTQQHVDNIIEAKSKNIYIMMSNEAGNMIRVNAKNRDKYEKMNCKFINEVKK